MAGFVNAEHPMSYLRTFGPRADPVTALTWGLLALSTVVVVVITLLVVIGVIVRRTRGSAETIAWAPVARPESGLGWIYIGIPLSLLALIGVLIWTVQALAAVDSPRTKPRLTLEITGHQWWWEVRYLDGVPADTFVTANEIHIPTGEPVRLRLTGADVIHSFWIPALSGKTDAIPGQTNIAWLQADQPGIYRGQCTEYCGEQHAHMATIVVAESPAKFAAWRAGQAAPATAPTSLKAGAGQALFVARCGACHTARGTEAGGNLGPDLTHLMSRSTIAAGALPNTVGALSGWIANPQAVKPGARMPATLLSGPELDTLRAYLVTLR